MEECTDKTKNSLADLMENTVAVVMLRLVGVPGRRQVPGTKVVATLDATRELTTLSRPTLSVLPPSWTSQISAIKTAAENIVVAAAPERPEDSEAVLPPGIHVVAKNRLADIVQSIEQLREHRLKPLVASIRGSYDAILAKHRQDLGDMLWSKIEPNMPKLSDLDLIQIRFVQLPITFINDVGRSFAEEVAANIITGISDAIAREAKRMQERGGNYREGSFTTLKRQFQLLRDFSFLTTDETLTKLAAAEELITAPDVVKSLNNKHAHEAVQAMNKIISDLGAEVAKDAGGRYRRRIVIAEED